MFNKLPHLHPTMAINKVYFTKYINQANIVIMQNGSIKISGLLVALPKRKGRSQADSGICVLKTWSYSLLMRQNPLISSLSNP